MMVLFAASVIAGIVSAAPFGPAGALVADAALEHDRKRAEASILAGVTGNSILAFMISFASSPAKAFFQKYGQLFFMVAGMVIIVLGLILWTMADFSGPSIVGRSGPAAVFFITLLHPGSVAVFLFITALFSMRFPGFAGYRTVFACGIAVGSFLAFGAMGVLFWKLRKNAEISVRRIRCGLAAMIVLAGVYLLIKSI